MSFPAIPSITPTISLTLTDTINLLLSSIAFEELALAHIMNAEAEKIQYILGTLTPGLPLTPPTLADLSAINTDVRRTLQTVIKKEMLLQFKFENIIDTLLVSSQPLPAPSPTIPELPIAEPPLPDCNNPCLI